MMSPSSMRKNGRKATSNGQNIKVFVRCRPLNGSEKTSKSFSCVECPNNREIVIKERSLDKFTKTFSFDRVFGQDSKQVDVYKAVAKNCVEEVLSGFNCTIFAYGQTGTGKTFTMEGERTPDNTSWDDEPLAGIIPRCVNHLFDELRIQKLEFTMRVSFLELYNEELFDLLSPHDDLSKLRLFEDSARKGSCIIQGLEEVLVRSKANVYEVLEKGSNKRQTASTLMNAHSSRSHTVFTVTLHIKENTVDGDELLKTGKLHLVDLAGSENIGRSGAIDKRAREAGNINMSLLTLGRVITALVEKTPHIPYRESKLTRLLQDALGGRTKTSIIATISPASINLEETLSTLDYAHRAKNIQNKPEVNQKLNKKELIGEYSQEIERLRLDLMAMREKSGVYLANENYQEMLQTMETQAQEITEKINYIRGLEEGIDVKTTELSSANTKLDTLSLQLGGLTSQLEEMRFNLSETKEVLNCTQKLLHQTSVACDEQKYLVSAHAKTEDTLLNQGKTLVELANTTTGDLTKLHEKLERKKNVEKTNQNVGKDFQDSYAKSVDDMKAEINNTVVQQKEALDSISTQFGGSVNQCRDEVSTIVTQWKEVCHNHVTVFNELHVQYKNEMEKELSSTQNFSDCRSQECQNQKALMKSFEHSVFLPAMERLATLISAEATTMSSMHQAVNGKLINLNEKCVDFVNKQSELISNHETKMQKLLDSITADASTCRTSFENLCKSVDTKVQALESKSNEMEVLLSSIRELNQGINLDISNTKSALPKSLSTLEEVAESAKVREKEFTTGCIKNNKRHLSNVKSLMNDLQDTVEQYNSESEQNVQHLGEERCGLESMVSQNVRDTKDFLDNMASNITSYKESAGKSAEKHIKDNSVCVEKATANIESDQEKMINSLEKEYVRLEQDLQSLKNECHIISASLQNRVDSHNDQLTCQKNQVLELFSERMVQDIPTGETPVRREYKFSRSLSTTSPHDRLLERYRAGTASTMSKIPLPSYADDTEDEVSSPPLESTHSSGSDSSHIEEDYIFETKSLSGSVSDVRSNSGSTTDLRSHTKHEKDVFAVPSLPHQNSRENSSLSLSRSSSTSSIPDIKDNKENSSSVQKGSTKKRGLRQPSSYSNNTTEKTAVQETQTRSRRVLGTQN